MRHIMNEHKKLSGVASATAILIYGRYLQENQVDNIFRIKQLW
jgi:hypothetical protein